MTSAFFPTRRSCESPKHLYTQFRRVVSGNQTCAVLVRFYQVCPAHFAVHRRLFIVDRAQTLESVSMVNTDTNHYCRREGRTRAPGLFYETPHVLSKLYHDNYFANSGRVRTRLEVRGEDSALECATFWLTRDETSKWAQWKIGFAYDTDAKKRVVNLSAGTINHCGAQPGPAKIRQIELRPGIVAMRSQCIIMGTHPSPPCLPNRRYA